MQGNWYSEIILTMQLALEPKKLITSSAKFLSRQKRQLVASNQMKRSVIIEISIQQQSLQLYNLLAYLILLIIFINYYVDVNGQQISDRLYPHRRQSGPAYYTNSGPKHNLLLGSANAGSSFLGSSANQFYLTNSINSPHNGKLISIKNHETISNLNCQN